MPPRGALSLSQPVVRVRAKLGPGPQSEHSPHSRRSGLRGCRRLPPREWREAEEAPLSLSRQATAQGTGLPSALLPHTGWERGDGTPGSGDPSSCPGVSGMGREAVAAAAGRGAPGAGEGRRAPPGTHLEFLLGHEVLHASDDLDGGPVVLPQPVGGTEGSTSAATLPGEARAVTSAPCAGGPGPLEARRAAPCSRDGGVHDHGLGAGAARGQAAFTRRTAPEGPGPACHSEVGCVSGGKTAIPSLHASAGRPWKHPEPTPAEAQWRGSAVTAGGGGGGRHSLGRDAPPLGAETVLRTARGLRGRAASPRLRDHGSESPKKSTRLSERPGLPPAPRPGEASARRSERVPGHFRESA